MGDSHIIHARSRQARIRFSSAFADDGLFTVVVVVVDYMRQKAVRLWIQVHTTELRVSRNDVIRRRHVIVLSARVLCMQTLHAWIVPRAFEIAIPAGCGKVVQLGVRNRVYRAREATFTTMLFDGADFL